MYWHLSWKKSYIKQFVNVCFFMCYGVRTTFILQKKTGALQKDYDYPNSYDWPRNDSIRIWARERWLTCVCVEAEEIHYEACLYQSKGRCVSPERKVETRAVSQVLGWPLGEMLLAASCSRAADMQGCQTHACCLQLRTLVCRFLCSFLLGHLSTVFLFRNDLSSLRNPFSWAKWVRHGG